MWFVITLYACLIVFVYSIFEYISHYRYIDKFYGEKWLPLVGNAHQMGRNTVQYLNKMKQMSHSYDFRTFRLFLGRASYVVVPNPEDAEVILSSTVLLDKMDGYHFMNNWLGEGLLTSTGQKWFQHRKIITPTFHFKILNEFTQTINENSNKLIDYLKPLATGETIDFLKISHLYTLDVMCETSMGVSLDCLRNPTMSFMTSLTKLCHILTNRFFNPFKRVECLFKLTSDYRTQKQAIKVISDFTYDVMKKRRILLLENDKITASNIDNDSFTKQRLVFLDTLLRATIDGKPLTDKDIADEVSTFIFEGQDTTAIALAFAVYCMSQHPELQEKVYREQCDIFGFDSERVPTYQEIQEMKYLDLFLKEVMRLYPSVPYIGRKTKVPLDLNGKHIPAGVNIVVNVIDMGQNPYSFENPTQFNPDRFLEYYGKERNPFSYVAFSAGPRNCIGQKFALLELKCTLSKLVRNFKILRTDTINFKPKLAIAVTLTSINGVELKLVNRKGSVC